MADTPIIANPLGWAHVRLFGGAKKIAMLAGGYALVLLFLSIVIFQALAQDVSRSAFGGAGVMILTIVELGLLLLIGAGSIRKAIQRDFASDMITSNRLTGMGGYTAVLGYLTGPTAQVMALTVVNILACAVFARMSTAGQPWAFLGVPLLFGMFLVVSIDVWCLSVLLGLCAKGKTGSFGLLVVLGLLSTTQFLPALPGMNLLMSPIMLTQIGPLRSTVDDPTAIVVGVVGHVVLAIIFFVASARKFARDDVLAFSHPLGLTLLAACAMLSALAMRFFEVAKKAGIPGLLVEGRVQFVTSLIVLGLMACLPVVNAATRRAQWSRRKSKDPAFDEPAPRGFMDAAVHVTLVVFGIFILVLGRNLPELVVKFGYDPSTGTFVDLTPEAALRALVIPASFLLTFFTLGGLMRFSAAATRNTAWLVVLFVFLCWGVPIVADLSLLALQEGQGDQDPALSAVFGISPVGTWLIQCLHMDIPIAPGLSVQALLAVGALVLARRAKFGGAI